MTRRWSQHDLDPFERQLLDAERAQADNPDVERAWARFRSSVGLVGSGLDGGSGVHQIAGPLSERNELAAVVPEAGAGLVSKLLTLGLGIAVGCAGTLAVVALGDQGVEESAAGAASGPSVNGVNADVSSQGESAPPAVTTPVHSALPEVARQISSAPLRSTVPQERREASNRSRALSPTVRTRSAGSANSHERNGTSAERLAEEVKHLDWMRRLSASGQHSQVLLSAGKYQERFASGVLAPEAEVLAVQALVALGKRDEAAQRARAFQRRFPKSPHLERVRGWAGASSE